MSKKHSFALVLLIGFLFYWTFSSYTVKRCLADSLISLSSHTQVRYDSKYLSDDEGEDHKLHQTADLNIVEKKWGHLRFAFSGDMVEDIDDIDDSTIDRTRSIHDTWSCSNHGYLYLCQAEIYRLGHLNYARFGRQYVSHELTTHIDGMNLLLNLSISDIEINPFVYGGIPVRLYQEAEYWDASEAGGGAHIVLNKSTKLTLEHQYIKETPDIDIIGTYSESGESEYHQSAVALRRSLFDNGYGYATFVMLDNCPKYVNSRFSFLFDKMDLEIDASYFYQFSKLSDNIPTTISPFSGLIGEIKPYHNATIDIMKGIYKDNIFISCGTEIRLLDYDEDETDFNHSYNHEYLAVIIDNLPIKGMHLSTQADFWKVMDNNDQDTIISCSLEVGYTKPRSLDFLVGSYYSLYKYDYFSNLDEKTDVYTVYSKARYYIVDGLYFDASYELESYDIYEHRFTAILGHEI
ncbi:MAG: hypothetical protein SVZ03_03665 [Spirochaetota bacterium]|nr:hypothetical protein [Spirochaetota bacterium]